MKKTITLFFLITIAISYSQVVPSFATKKSLGDNMCARESAGMTSFNDKLYIYGGYPMPGVQDFTEYNPVNGQLNKLIDLESLGSYNTSSKCLFTVQNTIYCLVDAVVLKYTFETNNWTPINMDLGPGISVNPDAGFVIGDTIYFTSKTGNGFFSFNTLTNVTIQLANYPSDPNRRGAFAFEIDGLGYFGSGSTEDGFCPSNVCGQRSDFYEYNPATNVWTEKASLPIGFQQGVGISHNGKGYAGLGLNFPVFPISPYNAGWYEYNPTTDNWTGMQNFMDAPSLNSGESMFASSISKIGDEIFVFGGRRGVGYLDEMYKYNTNTNTWTLVSNELGQNREGAMGFYTNGKIYVGGGIDNEGLSDFWEYDLASDNWTQKANFPVQYARRACVELNGKGYFVGGLGTYMTASPHTDELLEYDPTTDMFTYKAPYPNGNTNGMVAFSYNGNIYAGLGQTENGTLPSTFYKYNPLTDTWTLMSQAPFSGVGCSSFILDNIGYVMSPNAGNMGKYNFDTDTWTTETHPFPVGGTVNQAFTYNGNAYVNIDPGNTSPITLYKYDASNSTWSSVLNLSFKNSNQTLIPTPSGVYYCFGGGQVSHPLQLPNTNDVRMLKFDAAVSDDYGTFEPQSNGGYLYPLFCGSGSLPAGTSHTVYDNDGDLHTAVFATTAGIQSECYKVTAVDLSVPFVTATNNFANTFQETAMFLNKSVTFNNAQAFYSTGIFRIYFTTAELTKLVTDFNTLYNTSKTLNDIKLVRYANNSNGPSDSDPLNNTLPNSYFVYESTLNDYGIDKYFDINVASGSVGGELYAVLLSGENLSVNEIDKSTVRIYPNPTATVLNIQTQEKIIDIKIIDIAGRTTNFNFSSNRINVSNLSNGIYFITIQTANGTIKEKFIKD